MAPKASQKSSMQIDSQPLRRSSRIAQLQDTQNKQASTVAPTINKQPQKKTSSKKRNVSMKKQITSLFEDYEQMKISDLFKLVALHTTDETEKKLYYSVLQRIVRNINKFSIKNRVKEMYDKRVDVIKFVCSSLNLSFETVDDIFDVISCYKEVKDAQLRQNAKSIEHDLDWIIQSMTTIKI